jgi:hypothetical protein
MNCEILVSVWEGLKAFAGSGFFIALIGSFAGAFAGALGAQRIVERFKERELALLQLRNTNAAIMVAFSVCNSVIAIKHQHVASLHATFRRQKEELVDFKRKRDAGAIPPKQPFEFQADLRTLPAPLTPIDVLQTQVFERLSVTGRPLALVTTLSQTILSLASSIASRNAFIERLRATGGSANPEFLNLYFGLPSSSGVHSTEYADTIEAIHNLTDDAIFFSHLLCGDLRDYGTTILERYKVRFKDESQSVSKPDFNKAKEASLLPDETNYQDWLHGFGKTT